jgi:hypothetical protein
MLHVIGRVVRLFVDGDPIVRRDHELFRKARLVEKAQDAPLDFRLVGRVSRPFHIVTTV